MANSPFKNVLFPNLDPEAMDNFIKRKPEKEYKPLKRPDPSKKAGSKQYKVLIPTKKELKPLKPSPRNIHPIGPSAVAVAQKTVYSPTHFSGREPNLPNFRGEHEKYGFNRVREKILNSLKIALEKNTHLMHKNGNERSLFILNSPDYDFFDYYVSATEPETFIYDMNRVAENSRGITDLLSVTKPEQGFDSTAIKPKTSINLNYKYKSIYGLVPKWMIIPSWYRGFVDDTWINFWSSGSGADGHISLIGDLYGGEAIPTYGSLMPTTVVVPVNYMKSSAPCKNTLWIAKKIPESHDQFTDMVIVRPESVEDPDLKGYSLGKSFLYSDIFNNIEFHATRGMAQFNKFSVKLNGRIVCQSWDIRDIDEFIAPRHPYNGSWEIFAYKQSRFDWPKSKILRIAANELGRAWAPKYMAPWHKNWCAEFASWVIKTAGNDSIPHGESMMEETMGTSSLGKYFIQRSAYLNGDSALKFHGKEVPFEDIKEYVKPGYYINMHNAKHAGLFWKWDSRFDRYLWGELIQTRAIMLNGNSDYVVKEGHTDCYQWYASGEPPIEESGEHGIRHDGIYWMGDINDHDPWKVRMGLRHVEVFVKDGFGDTEKMIVGLAPK